MNTKVDKMIQVSLPSLQDESSTRHLAVSSTTPAHFTTYQLNKLEGIFSRQKWPDVVTLDVIALESNLSAEDIEAWFFSRRVEWMRNVMKAMTDSKTGEQ